MEHRATIIKRPCFHEVESEPTLSGYLEKLSQSRLGYQAWQRRWFEVRGTSLFYFHDRPPTSAAARPDGSIGLNNVITVATKPDNELVLTSRSGREIRLRVNAADFGASAALGAERAAEEFEAWLKVITAVSDGGGGNNSDSSSHTSSPEDTGDGGVQMKHVGSIFSQSPKNRGGDPEVALTTVHDMTGASSSFGQSSAENPLVGAGLAPAFSQKKQEFEGEEGDELPPVVRSFLVFLGLAPPRFGALFSGDESAAVQRGLWAMWLIRTYTMAGILTAGVLEIVIVNHQGDLRRACESTDLINFGASSLEDDTFSGSTDDDDDSSDSRCDAQVLLSVPVILDCFGCAVIYAWMVLRINEKTLIPTHRHRLNGYLQWVAIEMLVSWVLITVFAIAVSQLPDCPNYSTFREQFRGVLHTAIIGPVFYGFVFIYYSETYRLRCIIEDFGSLLRTSDEGNREARGKASRLASRMASKSASTLGDQVNDGAVVDWSAFHDAYQRCRGEFKAVQNMIGTTVSFYFGLTVIWVCSVIYHSYVAETLAEGALYTLLLVGSILPLGFVFWTMGSVNQAGGGDLIENISEAMLRSTAVNHRQGCPDSECGGVKLLLGVQAAPCALTSLGREITSGDFVYMVTLIFVTQLFAAFNVSS